MFPYKWSYFSLATGPTSVMGHGGSWIIGARWQSACTIPMCVIPKQAKQGEVRFLCLVYHENLRVYPTQLPMPPTTNDDPSASGVKTLACIAFLGETMEVVPRCPVLKGPKLKWPNYNNSSPTQCKRLHENGKGHLKCFVFYFHRGSLGKGSNLTSIFQLRKDYEERYESETPYYAVMKRRWCEISNMGLPSWGDF